MSAYIGICHFQFVTNVQNTTPTDASAEISSVSTSILGIINHGFGIIFEYDDVRSKYCKKSRMIVKISTVAGTKYRGFEIISFVRVFIAMGKLESG